MAKKLKLNEIAAYRKELGLNQQTFWNPLGVTQSGGSRYEGGRNVPPTVARLLLLREQGVITNAHLDSAAKEIAKQKAAAREAKAAAAKKDITKPRRTR